MLGPLFPSAEFTPGLYTGPASNRGYAFINLVSMERKGKDPWFQNHSWTWFPTPPIAGVPTLTYLVYHHKELTHTQQFLRQSCPCSNWLRQVSPNQRVGIGCPIQYLRYLRSKVSDMKIISDEHTVNEIHYTKHQTCGKGGGTQSQFEAGLLWQNVIEIPPPSILKEASIRRRPLNEEIR